ncbi:DNA-binding GntR family transcriptional regulator [Phyllobacterium endophyticum]|nr:DNA-binding GntR family transcriptional regulator [Phyllobacterium endophyticum]
MVVREAFQELLYAGFLVAEPRRGVRVAQLDPMSAEETTVLRSLLEPCLFNAAIPQMTDDDFERADAILDSIDSGETIDEKLFLSASFHDLLYARANRERFAGVVRQLRASFDRYLRLPIVDEAFARRSRLEHEEILACCREQRAADGAVLLREHILSTGAMIVSYLKSRT